MGHEFNIQENVLIRDFCTGLKSSVVKTRLQKYVDGQKLRPVEEKSVLRALSNSEALRFFVNENEQVKQIFPQ